VEFLLVYIREAHPSDGWVTRRNQQEGISIASPKTLEERANVCTLAQGKLKITMPTVVDGMNDGANKAYGAWPDRLYVIDTEGRVAVAGGSGPRGFAPAVQAARRWLAEHAPPAAP